MKHVGNELASLLIVMILYADDHSDARTFWLINFTAKGLNSAPVARITRSVPVVIWPSTYVDRASADGNYASAGVVAMRFCFLPS
jgi:hypothetical protein